MTTGAGLRRSFAPRFLIICLIFFAALASIRWVLLQGLPTVWHPPLAKLHWFEIRDVQVRAAPPLSRDLILSFLPKLNGESLLAIQPAAIYSQLKDRPWVQDVSIKKEYPDRLVLIVETKRAVAIHFEGGMPYFIGADGKLIEKVPMGSPEIKNLPFINGEIENPKWKISELAGIYTQLKGRMGSRFEISELHLTRFPVFKIFLSKPKIEIILSVENWQTQTDFLMTLLAGSPSQVKQIHKINLLFPKKAIVTGPISH